MMGFSVSLCPCQFSFVLPFFDITLLATDNFCLDYLPLSFRISCESPSSFARCESSFFFQKIDYCHSPWVIDGPFHAPGIPLACATWYNLISLVDDKPFCVVLMILLALWRLSFRISCGVPLPRLHAVSPTFPFMIWFSLTLGCFNHPCFLIFFPITHSYFLKHGRV